MTMALWTQNGAHGRGPGALQGPNIDAEACAAAWSHAAAPGCASFEGGRAAIGGGGGHHRDGQGE